MAINWDEVKRKGQQKGAVAESQVQFKRAVPSLPVAPPKPLPRIPTAVQSRRGNLPQPVKETVPFVMPMGQTIQVPIKGKGVLGEAFDPSENYIDKFKQGNIGGGVANVVGTGLTAAQTLYLNALNSADSLTQGKGLPKYQPHMGFTDYDKSVAERRGALPTIEKVSKINPLLGKAYGFVGEVLTDPLELTPAGYLNDIKMAKGFKPNTASYMAALQSGKLTPTVILKSGKKVASKADFDNLPPTEQSEVLQAVVKTPTTKPLQKNIADLPLNDSVGKQTSFIDPQAAWKTFKGNPQYIKNMDPENYKIFKDNATYTNPTFKGKPQPLPRAVASVKNAPVKKPSLDEFINSQSIFHGTTADIERPLIEHANIFEPTLNRGIYTTADKSIADNYGGSNGKVFTYKKPDIEKTFNYHNDKDLERVGIKIPDHYKSKTAYNEYMNKAWKSEGIDYSKNMDSAREDAIFDRLAIRALKNMGDGDAVNTWRNIKNTPLSEMAAEQDYMVEKVLNQINDDLIKDGFNFAQHKGGIRQGNKQHDVYIALTDNALEEQDVDSLAKLYNDTYGKPQETIPRATESTAQPILPQKGAEIPTEIKTPETAQKPIGKVEQKLKDLGADTNLSNNPQKTSRVMTNTFKNSTMFTDAEKELLNSKDFQYDTVTETQSLAQAKQRLEADFDGEVADLTNKSRFDGVDTDTAMGILEQYKREARQTGDYSKVYEWSKLIQERGTESGQMIQAFNKYTRTPEGAVVKAQQTINKIENDIKKTNPNLINKVEQETKQVTNAIKKAEEEAIESLGDVMEKVIKSRSTRKSSASLPIAGNPIRSVEEAVASLTDKNLGELIGEYTEASAKKLANQSDVLKKKTPKQAAPLQQAFDDLTKELYRIAQETLPKVKTAKQEVKATDILKSVIENKQNYQDVWLNAKYLLQRKYANNPEAMELLSNFFEKDVIPNFSKKTLDTAVKQTAKDFSADLNKLFKASQKDKDKLAKDIQDYILYKVGVRGDDAKALADEILNQYNAILKAKTESTLKQMFPEAYGKTLPKKGQKSTYQKVMELINMGAYDNEAIKNIIKAKNNLPVLENSEIKAIIENMELSAKQTDPYMKNMYASRAEQIMSDKIPAEFRKKFRALQRLSLILNPKTLITRNPLGNTLLWVAENVKDIPAAALDKAVSLKTGQRTTAFAPIAKTKAQIQGFGQGLSEWGKDIKYGVDTSPSRGQFELPSGRIFKNPVLNKLDYFERYALQAGDRPFYQSAYNGRIAELKKLGKVGEDAELDAKLYALDRVFQNNSELSQRAVQIRKSLGLPGDLIMPFTQTPANILDKLIDYSPAGLGKAVYQLGTTAGKGTFNQKKFVDTLARSFTGAGISALTYAMMQKGILKGSLSDNTDLREAQYFQGQQAYSIKIGDKWYSYDWAQPIAGIMAATADAIKAGMTKDDLSEALMEGGTSGINSIFNQSFLSGILTAFSGYSPASGIGKALLSSTSQLTPTVGAGLAKTIDPTMRETYDPNTFKQQSNKLIARIPFLSKTLPARVDVAGKEIQQNQGRNLGARIGENFLAPYKLSQETNDPVNAELMRLQSMSGDNAVLLNKTPKAFEKDGEKYLFTSNEYIQYQKTVGDTAYKNIEKLIKTPSYRAMTDEEKTEAVKDIHSAAMDKGKYEYFDNKNLPVTLALSKEYQEKYNTIKAYVSDKQFYTAVKSIKGKTQDIEKVYAIESKLPNASNKLYSALGISEEIVEKAKGLKQYGISDTDYQTAKVEANTNGNSNVSKVEAVDYLNTTGFDNSQKYIMLKALVPNLKDKNNPYY